MNAELKREPGTEGPPCCRHLMLETEVHEVEIEMNKQSYNLLIPNSLPHSIPPHTHTYPWSPAVDKRGK